MNKQQYAEQFGRLIKPNEIVFDFDSRDFGFHGINFTAINLYEAEYKFEIWYAEGQKSPHLHIKNIFYLYLEEDLKKDLKKQWLKEDLREEEFNILGKFCLTKEQLQKYKKLFMRRYAPKEFLKYLDIKLIGKHRIAEENKPHYKYKTIKRLCGIWNETKENFSETDLLEEAKQVGITKTSRDLNTFAVLLKDKIKITEIAQKYGINVKGETALCPFHDDKTPSLSLSNKKGLFNCFGCGAKGDLITFYGKLKRLKNG